jgi:hypothetical protein
VAIRLDLRGGLGWVDRCGWCRRRAVLEEMISVGLDFESPPTPFNSSRIICAVVCF